VRVSETAACAPDTWLFGAFGGCTLGFCFLNVANMLSLPFCTAYLVTQQIRGAREALMLPFCSRLDPTASTGPAPPLPESSKYHQVHPSMATLEPLSPFEIDDVFNGSEDDAFSSFMDPVVGPPEWEGPPPSGPGKAAPAVDRSPGAGTKAGNPRRRRRREPAKLGDAPTFEKRITSDTYLRRLYLTRQQAVALAPIMARVAEMHDHTKDPATTVSARVAVLDEHNVLHELECKCYLSSREHHFVLCTGWSALTKQSGVALGDAVVFSRVGQGRFRVERVKGGV